MDSPPLTASGPAQILFVGAEYCPFCAAERWPLVVALARFGRFPVLHDAASSTRRSSRGRPLQLRRGATLQPVSRLHRGRAFSSQVGADGSSPRSPRLTPAQAALVARYRRRRPGGGRHPPFVDIGGRMVVTTRDSAPPCSPGSRSRRSPPRCRRRRPPRPTRQDRRQPPGPHGPGGGRRGQPVVRGDLCGHRAAARDGVPVEGRPRRRPGARARGPAGPGA